MQVVICLVLIVVFLILAGIFGVEIDAAQKQFKLDGWVISCVIALFICGLFLGLATGVLFSIL